MKLVLALAFTLLACKSTPPPPTASSGSPSTPVIADAPPESPEAAAPEPTPDAPAPAPDAAKPDTKPPAGAKPAMGENCGAGDSCAAGLECVKYYGIAGARGPEFKTCEVKCAGKKAACPSGTKCITIADGPGQVCRP